MMRPTSGAMMIEKSSQAAARMRKYITAPRPARQADLGQDRRRRGVVREIFGGQLCQLYFRLAQYKAALSRLAGQVRAEPLDLPRLAPRSPVDRVSHDAGGASGDRHRADRAPENDGRDHALLPVIDIVPMAELQEGYSSVSGRGEAGGSQRWNRRSRGACSLSRRGAP